MGRGVISRIDGTVFNAAKVTYPWLHHWRNGALPTSTGISSGETSRDPSPSMIKISFAYYKRKSSKVSGMKMWEATWPCGMVIVIGNKTWQNETEWSRCHPELFGRPLGDVHPFLTERHWNIWSNMPASWDEGSLNCYLRAKKTTE